MHGTFRRAGLPWTSSLPKLRTCPAHKSSAEHWKPQPHTCLYRQFKTHKLRTVSAQCKQRGIHTGPAEQTRSLPGPLQSHDSRTIPPLLDVRSANVSCTCYAMQHDCRRSQHTSRVCAWGDAQQDTAAQHRRSLISKPEYGFGIEGLGSKPNLDPKPWELYLQA